MLSWQCFLSLSASAQQITASGQILDAQKKEPLIGVSVQEKGTSNGAITDLDGNFTLNVKQNAILIFSYVGYKSQEVKAAQQMKITLQEDNEVLDEVVSHFPEGSDTDEEDDRPKVAIIGKPNVGKSSIINKLVGKNRVIVSDIAGTTRDAIDTAIKYNGKEYVFIDTAGLRRKSKIKRRSGAFQYHKNCCSS